MTATWTSPYERIILDTESKIRELTNQTEKINGLNRFFLQFYTANESLFLISLLDKSKTSTERVERFAYENN